MLASTLSASGYRVGLYTSPHILDFRERMRIMDEVDGGTHSQMISQEDVLNFIERWNSSFDELNMSFFEITTVMAFDWFAKERVDIAIIETGLGGRLDSTNILSPILSIITNIGLDHCDLLGDTREKIAFEKGGIIKPHIPVIVGEGDEQINGVFNIIAGESTKIIYANSTTPELWNISEEILVNMDLKGCYQRHNLRTVLTAVDTLSTIGINIAQQKMVIEAITHTATRCGFSGRWEELHKDGYPRIICDIGHNSHGLKYNFKQLESMIDSEEIEELTLLFGMVADKDISNVLKLIPQRSCIRVIFTNASTARALPSAELAKTYKSHYPNSIVESTNSVEEALIVAKTHYTKDSTRSLLYIGGSTYVVSEAKAMLQR
jgi:dihydrofolate synthase/folylpolyglutamate synthase